MPSLDDILAGSTPSTVVTPDAAAPAAQPSSSPASADPGKQNAPAAGQDADSTGKTDKTADPAPVSTDGQAEPQISDDELLNAAGLTETPDRKLSRLERDYAASSKETRRKDGAIKGLEAMLGDQEIKIEWDEQGQPVGLLAGKGYSKESAAFNLKFKDLPEEIQAKIEDDPQVLVDFVMAKAAKALIRVTPTLDKQVVPVSQERHETVVGYLADMKWETGDAKFPGLAANRKLIEKQINAPNVPKALKDFYNQEPELAVSLLNLQFDHARAHVTEQAKKLIEATAAKKKDADNSAQPTPSGGGSPTIGGDGTDDIGTAVATAKTLY